MTSFNETLSIQEATTLFRFKGKAMWPDTAHNRAVMATLWRGHIEKLNSEKVK